MAASISCPRCERLVDPQTRICVHCGVDLALAAIQAESTIIDASTLTPGSPISPELLVPKIGEYLVKQGFLSSADIEKALRYQAMKAGQGTPLLLGQALLELGLIDRPVLDEVITRQIIQLHLALQRANQELERQVQERTQQLQDVLSRLSDLNQLKANFIANISHELRTPLTHIKGYIDILADGGLGTLNPEQSEALAVLKRAENRLERLIEDLIQFSLASRGELHLNLNNASIEKII